MKWCSKLLRRLSLDTHLSRLSKECCAPQQTAVWSWSWASRPDFANNRTGWGLRDLQCATRSGSTLGSPPWLWRGPVDTRSVASLILNSLFLPQVHCLNLPLHSFHLHQVYIITSCLFHWEYCFRQNLPRQYCFPLTDLNCSYYSDYYSRYNLLCQLLFFEWQFLMGSWLDFCWKCFSNLPPLSYFFAFHARRSTT